MDKDDRQEIELERELDHLYRKVAGLTLPEDSQEREETAHKQKTLTRMGSHPAAPTAERAFRRKGRTPFLFKIAWSLLGTIVFLAMVALFVRVALDRYPAITPGVGDGPQAKNRPSGEEAHPADKEGRRYPIPSEAIILTTEEAKKPVSEPLSSKDGESGHTKLHDSTAQRGGPQGSYAIQIRAYPEDQKQNAITFLEDIRKVNPDASLETVSIPERGIWHRILLGDFSSEEAAIDFRQNRGVAIEYPYSFIQKKSGK
jgi:hypothetical protein